ncbi:MAG: 50S ribosomal protein L22 [Caldicoprobacter sp.]|uniref:50S ribosomal protein L22 n=1 Tax=Caldicoprobacter sp. TaxID=2004500 RepID=UPI00396F26D9
MATRIREKAKAREQNKDTRPRAIARYIRMSPRKVRAVIDLIRGKTVNEALAILANTPRAAAKPVMKVLKSAIANAENNMNMSQDNLYVAEIYADQGPTLKRIRPRARGMAYIIRKRTSHITVVLDEINK